MAVGEFALWGKLQGAFPHDRILGLSWSTGTVKRKHKNENDEWERSDNDMRVQYTSQFSACQFPESVIKPKNHCSGALAAGGIIFGSFEIHAVCCDSSRYTDDCTDNEEHEKVNESQPETLDFAWNLTKSSRASISLARGVFSKTAASFVRA